MNTTDPATKFENLQALRGVAVMLVVLAHIGIYERRFFAGEPYLQAFAWVGGAGVDLFFVISGFVMTMISQGPSQAGHASLRFLVRRCVRIYPLYWVFTLVYLPVLLYAPQAMNRPEGSAGIDLLRSFLLLPHSQGPLVGQGWSLVHEMYFYGVFAVVLQFPARFKPALLLLWGALLVAGGMVLAHHHEFQGSPTLRLITSPFTFEFLAGCAIHALTRHAGPAKAAICLALGVAGLLLSVAQGRDVEALSQLERLLWCGLPCALLVLGAVGLEVHRGVMAPHRLRRIGDASYSIYLSHMIVVSGGHKLLRLLGLDSSAAAQLLYVCASIVLAIGVGFGVHRLLEKPMLRAGHRWLERWMTPASAGRRP